MTFPKSVWITLLVLGFLATGLSILFIVLINRASNKPESTVSKVPLYIWIAVLIIGIIHIIAGVSMFGYNSWANHHMPSVNEPPALPALNAQPSMNQGHFRYSDAPKVVVPVSPPKTAISGLINMSRNGPTQ